jgi:diacylglycerol O-acyltransferase
MTQGFQFDDRLSALDEIMLRAETNPKTRNWVLSLVILDKKPNASRVLEQFERASREFVRLRQVVIPAPTPMGYARWQAVEYFDPQDHFEHVALPRGSSFEDLLQLACNFINRPGDLTRPLWEAMLIDNVKHPEGKCAFMMRMHHAIADGMGAVQLFLSLFDTQADGTPREFLDPPQAQTMSWLARARADLRDSLPDAKRLATGAAKIALAHLTSPLSQWREDKALLDSVQRLYGTKGAPGSPLLAERSMSRQFLAWDFPFPPFKQALKNLGWSVNDGYLTALTLGLKRYHEELHCPIESMPLTIPVNVRRGGDGEQTAGNHIAPVKLALPMDLDDPHEIAEDIGDKVRSAVQEPALGLMSWVAPTIKGAPQFVVDKIAEAMAEVDVQASNVPGYPFAPYFAGSKITRSYPFAPLPGVAAMVALYTQNDVAHVGIQLDKAAIDDTERFERCLKAAFEGVIALGA